MTGAAGAVYSGTKRDVMKPVSVLLMMVVLLAGAACRERTARYVGRPCPCARDFVCHPERTICVEPVVAQCEGGGGPCPGTTRAGDRCDAPGSFLPCDASVRDCSLGCMTCEDDGVWSACSPLCSWSFRRSLTFDTTEAVEDVTDVPILVVLDPSRIDYGAAGPGGRDLRFVSDGGRPLVHEIESWAPGGTSYVWLRVPLLAPGSSAGFARMYYGNPSPPAAPDPTAVWSNGYVGVWHMDQDPGAGAAGDIRDSTAYENHGTAAVEMSSADLVSGVIEGAIAFDTELARIEVGATPSLAELDPLTISAWVRADSSDVTTIGRVISKGDQSTGWYLERDRTAPEVDAYELTRVHEGSQQRRTTSNDVVAFDAWQWILATTGRSSVGDDLHIFLDGEEALYADSVDGAGARPSDAAMPVVIGHGNNASYYFGGSIDEVRLAGVERSAEWVRTQVQSMTDGLITYGPEEPVVCGP